MARVSEHTHLVLFSYVNSDWLNLNDNRVGSKIGSWSNEASEFAQAKYLKPAMNSKWNWEISASRRCCTEDGWEMFKKFKKHVHNRCSSHLTYFLVASVLVAIAVVVCLSTRVFETRTATGSELFSLLTCPHRTPFTLLRIFSPSEMSVIKKSGRRHGSSTRNVF